MDKKRWDIMFKNSFHSTAEYAKLNFFVKKLFTIIKTFQEYIYIFS